MDNPCWCIAKYCGWIHLIYFQFGYQFYHPALLRLSMQYHFDKWLSWTNKEWMAHGAESLLIHSDLHTNKNTTLYVPYMMWNSLWNYVNPKAIFHLYASNYSHLRYFMSPYDFVPYMIYVFHVNHEKWWPWYTSPIAWVISLTFYRLKKLSTST